MGDCSGVSLGSVLVWIEQAGLTGVLAVATREGHGEIVWWRGQPVAAQYGGIDAEQAIVAMLHQSLGAGHFSFDRLPESAVASYPRSVQARAAPLVLDATRQSDEQLPVSRSAPTADLVRRDQADREVIPRQLTGRRSWAAAPFVQMAGPDRQSPCLTIWAVLPTVEIDALGRTGTLSYAPGMVGQRLAGYVWTTHIGTLPVRIYCAGEWFADRVIDQAAPPQAILYMPRHRHMRYFTATERSLCAQTVVRAAPPWVIGLVDPESAIHEDAFDPLAEASDAVRLLCGHRIARVAASRVTPEMLLRTVVAVHAGRAR